MEKVKKVVNEEVEAVQITKAELIDLTSKICAEVFTAGMDNDEPEMAFAISDICVKFSAQLVGRIFDENDKNEESEEN